MAPVCKQKGITCAAVAPSGVSIHKQYLATNLTSSKSQLLTIVQTINRKVCTYIFWCENVQFSKELLGWSKFISINSMSVRRNFNQLSASSHVAFMGVTFYVRYKSIVKRSALEVNDGKVPQSSMYERKESKGSNVLHMVGVQLSQVSLWRWTKLRSLR